MIYWGKKKANGLCTTASQHEIDVASCNSDTQIYLIDLRLLGMYFGLITRQEPKMCRRRNRRWFARKIEYCCVETTAYLSAWKNSRHEMIVAESSQRLRQDNAERRNQRIHTIVIKLTRIRAKCIFGVALYIISAVDAGCCKEHFVSRRRETDWIYILNG